MYYTGDPLFDYDCYELDHPMRYDDEPVYDDDRYYDDEE